MTFRVCPFERSLFYSCPLVNMGGYLAMRGAAPSEMGLGPAGMGTLECAPSMAARWVPGRIQSAA